MDSLWRIGSERQGAKLCLNLQSAADHERR